MTSSEFLFYYAPFPQSLHRFFHKFIFVLSVCLFNKGANLTLVEAAEIKTVSSNEKCAFPLLSIHRHWIYTPFNSMHVLPEVKSHCLSLPLSKCTRDCIHKYLGLMTELWAAEEEPQIFHTALKPNLEMWQLHLVRNIGYSYEPLASHKPSLVIRTLVGGTEAKGTLNGL